MKISFTCPSQCESYCKPYDLLCSADFISVSLIHIILASFIDVLSCSKVMINHVTSPLTSWHTSKISPFSVVFPWNCISTTVIAEWQESGLVHLWQCAEPPAGESSNTCVEAASWFLALWHKGLSRQQSWLAIRREKWCRLVSLVHVFLEFQWLPGDICKITEKLDYII